MYAKRVFALALAAVLVAGCGGSSSGSSGSFSLIEFLDSGKNEIPRNRAMEFRFSAAVDAGQDLSERLKIQNVQAGGNGSNFAKARGSYVVNGEIVRFVPALPTKSDRSDAGFKADANYHVFVKGGPDALRSTTGEAISRQQEFIFDTNSVFEDRNPSDPPRAFGLSAIDPTNGNTTDLSRFDPRPFKLAQVDNATLVAEGRVIDPGAGAEFGTPWRFELVCNEAVDPSTINGDTVQMHEIRSNAFTDAPTGAPDEYLGDPVNFRVPIHVSVEQGVDDQGQERIRLVVTAAQTLVDNTRYRLSFSGSILGIDFRKTFAGDNGLTGDGQTEVDGAIFKEDGGRGYVTEFLVADREGIDATRTLLYDPFLDGIEPEDGQTTDDEEDYNSALYNPAQAPGAAVGFLSAFGNGSDGPYAVAGGGVTELNTGDTPNEPLGNPFEVIDLNPDDNYLANTLPGELVSYDSVQPFELQLESFTISSSATLRIVGVNPVLFRVNGIVQITGTLDVQGEDGKDGGNTFADGGAAGAGGFDGADAGGGWSGRTFHTAGSGTCASFSNYLNAAPGAKAAFSGGQNGDGPGRGLGGGDGWVYYASDQKNRFCTSAGGGGSHATQGGVGEDRMNASQPDGSAGVCGPTSWPTRLAGVVGVRGQPGPSYGDRDVAFNNMGGSGGGSGGANYSYQPGTNFAGGAGGGGGGSVTFVAAGAIQVQGGSIDASGGNGGQGGLKNIYPIQNSTNWDKITGGGGGGAGGTISLISGDNIELTGAILNAAGGIGGPRATDGITANSSKDNAGGDGGQGFIFLMDADGEITGFLPSAEGNYDTDARGVLSIRAFDASRFSSIAAVTELFPMTAANPRYTDLNATEDILGNVNPTQRIRIVVSSAKGSDENPLVADPGTELDPIEMAMLQYDGGATKVTITGDMGELNETPGSPNREAFVRIRADFEYDDGVEAALGPFASMDMFTVSYRFNE
ncbi:MAG: hypothetical protein ACYTGZ_20755 [Planctomycetota bacterium]|jgi:hypothetical protein